MNSRPWFRLSGSVPSAIFVAALASLLATAPAQAQNLTGTGGQPIGSPLTATVTVPIATSGTPNKISVNGADYAIASGNTGTCSTSTAYTAPATCTVQVTFTPTHPGMRYGGVSLSNSSGALLGSDFFWGTGSGPQVSYPIGATTGATTLGSGLSTPSGIAVDGSGNVYVADNGTGAGNQNIKELSAAGVLVNTWTGFTHPKGVAVDGNGNIYVADTANAFISELVAVAGVVPASPTIVQLGSGFSSPSGVAVDGSGNVYVADTVNNAVKEIFAATPTATPTTLNSASAFNLPAGVAVDGSGNVYVADTGNGAVKELVAASGAVAPGTAPKTLATGFTTPSGVAVDGNFNIYVADSGSSSIKELLATSTFPIAASSATPLGSFTAPTGVAVDASGNVYVADAGTGITTAKVLSAQINTQTVPTLTFTSTTAVGLTSADSPKTVTIANNGNAPLTITVPATASTNFGPNGGSCTSLPSNQLPAGQSCAFGVNFLPTVVGTPLAGTLKVTDNAAGSPQTIANLSGNSTKGTLAVTASSTPASVPLNTTTPVTLTASIAYGGVVPTGAVTFTVGGTSAPGTVSCPPVTSSPLICTLTYNPAALVVASSPYAIVASVATDTNYNTASSTNSATLTITPVTPVLTISPTTTITVNASPTLTFTATLTSATGFSPNDIASGDTVAFTSNGSPISACATATLTSHKATCTIPSFPGGSYSIGATFNPAVTDTNFLTSPASPVTQTVNPETPVLTLSQPTAITVNASPTLTFTATLTSATGFSPNDIASGDTVAFTSNGSPISCATGTFTNHIATCTVPSSPAGSYSIRATFNPAAADTSFLTAPATPVTQTVTSAPATLAFFPPPPSSASVDTSVTFTAQLSSTAGFAPVSTASTDTVTFTLNGTTVLCSNVPLNQSQQAACTTSALPAGTDKVIATFSSGDPNFYFSGTAPTATTTVTPANTTTTVTSVAPTSGSSISVGVPLTLTATVLPASGIQTLLPQIGTLNFYDSLVSATAPVCSVKIVAGVVPSCTTYSFSISGSHTITASYSNISGASTDPNFSSSSISAGNTVTVGTATSTVTITSPTTTATIYVDQKITLTATVAPAASNLTGNITFSSNGAPICAPVTISNFTATCTTGSLPMAGSNNSIPITAAFTDTDGNFSGSSTTENVTVLQTPLTLTATLPTNAQVDSQATFAATLTLPSTVTTAAPTTPSAKITFTVTDTGATCTTPVVTTTGSSIGASCQLTVGTAGTHPVTVAYGTDNNFSSTTITGNVTVAKTVLTLSPPSTLPAPQLNTLTSFTATLSLPSNITDTAAGDSVPGGTMTFTPDIGTPCTTPAVTLSGSTFQASCQLTVGGAVGTHNVTVSYGNDANFSATGTTGAPTITEIVTVGQATPGIAIASNLNPSVATQTVTFTATATFPSATPAPTKTVAFNLPSPYVCSSLAQAGTGPVYTYTCIVTFPVTASGPQSVSATYGTGDLNYATATSLTLNQTVQNFTLSAAAPAALTISQGNTNLSDTYTTQAISLAETAQNGFTDPLTVTCSFTTAPATGTPAPVTTGLSCPATGLTGTTIMASSSVTPGPYTVTYTVSDHNVPTLFHTSTASLTIVNQAPAITVASLSTAAATFTAPSGLTITGLACNQNVATLISGTTYTTSTNQTLTSLHLQCTNFASTSNGYTFTIAAGVGVARLETGNGGIFLACLGAPCLLMLGLLPASRKFRKAFLHSLAVVALGMLLIHATGCGSGSFPEPLGTHATDGSYLLDIVNGAGTVAEVPVVVSN